MCPICCLLYDVPPLPAKGLKFTTELSGRVETLYQSDPLREKGKGLSHFSLASPTLYLPFKGSPTHNVDITSKSGTI